MDTNDAIIVDEVNEVKQDVVETTDVKTDVNEIKTDVKNEKPNIDNTINIDGTSYKTNDKGDALNEDGSVFKTKDELDTQFAEQDAEDSVDIGGVVYKIDKDGNAVDDKGAIKYTKEQLDTEFKEDGPKDELVVDEIMKEVNIPILDAEGNQIEYEPGKAGLTNYILDVYEVAKQEGANEQYQQLANQFPILPKLIKHLSIGGTINDFKEQTDYSNVTLDKKNVEQLKTIITDARLLRGDRKEAIDKYIGVLENGDSDNDSLYKEAELELQFINEKQAQTEAETDRLISQRQQEELDSINEYWGITVDKAGNLVNLNKENSVYSKVMQGKLKLKDEVYTIPDKIRVVENGKTQVYDRNAFFRYLYEPIPVKIGNDRVMMTRDQLKLRQEAENRNVDNDIYDSFMRFVNYDKTQFINEQINNNNVKQIKKLVSKNTKRGSVINNPKSGDDDIRIV